MIVTRIEVRENRFRKMDNSDSEEDMYLVQSLVEVENKLMHNPLLFARPDGLPMAFHIVDDDGNVKSRIEDCGGVVVGQNSDMYEDNVIKICSGNSKSIDNIEDVFDVEFIYESIKQGNIVNLGNYRISNSLRMPTYDPTDVLLGYKTWNNIEITEEIGDEKLVVGNMAKSEITDDENEELITEDEIWESRNPEHIYESQEPDKLTYESQVIGTPEYIQSPIHGICAKTKVTQILDVKDTKVGVKCVESSKIDSKDEELITEDEIWEDWDPKAPDTFTQDSQVIGTPEFVQSLIYGRIQ